MCDTLYSKTYLNPANGHYHVRDEREPTLRCSNMLVHIVCWFTHGVDDTCRLIDERCYIYIVRGCDDRYSLFSDASSDADDDDDDDTAAAALTMSSSDISLIACATATPPFSM